MAVELTHIVAVMNETKQLQTLVFHSYDPRNLSTSCTLNQLLKESKIISIKKIQNSEIELSYEYGLMVCWKRKKHLQNYMFTIYFYNRSSAASLHVMLSTHSINLSTA